MMIDRPGEGGEASIFMEMRFAQKLLGCHSVHQDGGISWVRMAKMLVAVDRAITLHHDGVERWRLLLDVVGRMVWL
jgi:hypothetical protein